MSEPTPPVATAAAACQDCYKCVRECPVKAIRVEDGAATILAEQCIACGHCVRVCPAGAKRIRDDRDRVATLLRADDPVYVSLAPSWVSEFPKLTPEQMVAGLRALGFAGVGATAAGAQEVSAHCAELLEREPGTWLSSACPAAVAWATRYTGLGERVTPLLSPALAHARLLRERFGAQIAVVFIGPCIAKKLEADAAGEELAAALTFSDLRAWWEESGIDPTALEPDTQDAFCDPDIAAGALYPLEGGMLAGIRDRCAVTDPQLAGFSGMRAIERALSDLSPDDGVSRFLELLACEGGCVNGPCTSGPGGTVTRRGAVLAAAPEPPAAALAPSRIDIATHIDARPANPPRHDATALRRALAAVGKRGPEDELNCGGCGYETCRAFAAACLEGKAEAAMCVTYMRRLAQNKATTLLHAMPSAAVLVDSELYVVESNRAFLGLVAPDGSLDDRWEARPGLAGASLPKLTGCWKPFRHVLDTATDLVDRDLRQGERIWRVSVFSVEPHRLVAGILSDITAPTLRRQEILDRAGAVIERQLDAVQQVACILGENAAESEILLGSITEALRGSEQRDA
ncbi:MAG: [Fe-Fe] hydrogenase large subunit C-terminal domain-containing protein [Planctomycetota bacterium]